MIFEGLAESAGLHILPNDEGLTMTDQRKPEVDVSALSFEKAVAELEASSRRWSAATWRWTNPSRSTSAAKR
jgi:hypothetical protein